jgi:hypothetical protein
MPESPVEETLKDLSIGFLLRSFFTGVFFVISYRVGREGYFFPTVEDILKVYVPVALVAGVTAYALHRALVYPLLFESWLDSGWGIKLRNRRLGRLIRKETVDRIIRNWDAKGQIGKFGQNNNSPEDSRKDMVQRNLRTWADYTHQLYCSALCILLGAITVVSIDGIRHHPVSWPITSLMFILILSGLISDWRLRVVQDVFSGTAPPPEHWSKNPR